ncbi:hypothetical protein [Dongia sp.]|uniref:hypothetical protein n=1 Tax=Dongia sp. TaxID=1977262 RepID=UPI0035AED475
MIYRVQINDPDDAKSERWFARQLKSQYSRVIEEPLPPEWRELLQKLIDALERPSS